MWSPWPKRMQQSNSYAFQKGKEQRGRFVNLGCAILLMTVHYKKANAVALTNVCLFIKWVKTHKTTLNYLVEIKIFHHRNKGKQRKGDKIGKALWNSSWKPCFSKGNTESLTNAMAHESLSTCQTNHSSKILVQTGILSIFVFLSTLRED